MPKKKKKTSLEEEMFDEIKENRRQIEILRLTLEALMKWQQSLLETMLGIVNRFPF